MNIAVLAVILKLFLWSREIFATRVGARERMVGKIASGKENWEYISRLSAGPRGKGRLLTSEAFLIFKSKRTGESSGARKKVAKFYRKVL